MTTVAPVPIAPAPPVPNSSTPEPTFDAQYEAFNSWERDQLVPGANDLAENVFANAQAAEAAKAGTDGAVEAATAQAGAAMVYRNTASNAANAANDARNEAVPAAATATAARDQAVIARNQAVAAADSIAGGPVTSVNNKTGVVTLALADLMPAHGLGNASLDGVFVTGAYTFAVPAAGAPTGVTNGILWVVRAGDRVQQTVSQPATGLQWVRSAADNAGAPVWSIWRRVAFQNDVATPLAGGAIDCSKGDYFSETVNGARAFSFVNIPPGPWSCVLELAHIAGGLTMPASSVWVGGIVPNFTTNKKHVVYFQRLQIGSAIWLMSALPNSAL